MSTIKTLWITLVSVLVLVPTLLTIAGIVGVVAGVYFVSAKLILGGVASYIGASFIDGFFERFVYAA